MGTMQKIASPQELQAEIRAIMAFVHASEKPDRRAIASKLRELADRVAASGPTFKVKDVGSGEAKGKGEHIEVEISGTVGRIEVKGELRRVSLGLDEITPRLVSRQVTLNRADGSGKAVPSGAKRKVEQALLKKLQEMQRAYSKKKGKQAAGRMKFRVHTGPTQVKEVAKRLQRAGIDAHDGTEHAFGTIDADDKYDAMDKINKAVGYKLVRNPGELRSASDHKSAYDRTE